MYNNRENSFRGSKKNSKHQNSKRVVFDHERVNNSVFKSPLDESSVKSMLVTVIDGLGNLQRDEKGLLSIYEVANVVAEKNTSLSYVRATHLLELYLKDPDELIRLEGDRIGKKNSNFVEPPRNLYFGTLERYYEQMVENGIHSSTKPFIRLYENEDDAVEFAKQFIRFGQTEEDIRTIEVLADMAYQDGIKFSTSEKPGEFLTSSISPNYINENLND